MDTAVETLHNTAPKGQELRPGNVGTPPDSDPPQETMFISRLAYETREFTFAREIPVTMRYEDGLWIYESKEHQLIGYDENREEAELTFKEDFVATWDHIGCYDTDNMTQRAKQLRTKLRTLVASERQVT